MHAPFDDEPTLARMELLGTLARACRLALQELEEADTVAINLNAGPEGMTVDVSLSNGEVHLSGWGQ
jgi:hypothetical protein